MKYDDYQWHLNGKDFPKNGTALNAATHIAFYLFSAIKLGIASTAHISCRSDLEGSTKSSIVDYFLQKCDGKLTDEDFSNEGNRFTRYYFNADKSRYFEDYHECFSQFDSIYLVPDSKEYFAQIFQQVSAEYIGWKSKYRDAKQTAFEQFNELLADYFNDRKYTVSKNNSGYSKKWGAVTAKIESKQRDPQNAYINLKITSYQLKKWRTQHQINNPDNTLLLGGVNLLLRSNKYEYSLSNKEKVHEAANQFLALYENELEPLFETFSHSSKLSKKIGNFGFVPGLTKVDRFYLTLFLNPITEVQKVVFFWFAHDPALKQEYFDRSDSFRQFQPDISINPKVGTLCDHLLEARERFGLAINKSDALR